MYLTDLPKPRQFLTIVLAYVLCYGLTANFITPVQQSFLSEETVFASLMYLPHGVRVLSVMIFGWRAVPALVAGNIVSGMLFAPAVILERDLIPYLLPIIVASSSGWVAFEVLRLFGKNYYATAHRSLHWKQIVLVGALASVINSVGQSLVLGQLFDLVDNSAVWLMFAVGDLVGLLAALFVLMLIFRWLRLNPGDAGSKAGSQKQ